MKYRLHTAIILILCIVASCRPTSSPSPSPSDGALPEVLTAPSPRFVHTVYFWLKDDNPALRKQFIDEGLPALAKVPSIQNAYWGPPAATDRDVIDSSYDVAWITTFATPEDQDAYQVDPIHLQFVALYSPLFAKVQVYDNLVTSSR